MLQQTQSGLLCALDAQKVQINGTFTSPAQTCCARKQTKKSNQVINHWLKHNMCTLARYQAQLAHKKPLKNVDERLSGIYRVKFESIEPNKNFCISLKIFMKNGKKAKKIIIF